MIRMTPDAAMDFMNARHAIVRTPTPHYRREVRRWMAHRLLTKKPLLTL